MSETRIENANNIIRDYSFEISNEISPDLKCTFCKYIMINSCIVPCGCRSCLGCLIKYLNGNEKVCPGERETCKITNININESVQIDQEINRKIASLFVKCPFETCSFTNELKWIDEHMRVCNFRPMTCPYLKLGCREPEVVNDTMKNHLFKENYSHTKLLMEWIDNLWNEIESLRLKVIEFQREMETLIINNKEYQTRIDALETEKANTSAEIEILKLTVNTAKTNSESMQIQLDNETESMKNKFNALKVENEKNQMEMMKEMKVLAAKLNKFQSNLEMQNHGEFIWIIEDFSVKRRQALERISPEFYSDPFYSHKNGYKMCLRVNPDGIETNGDIHFAVALCLMQGPFDDLLSWPFTNDVTLALVNQTSGLVHSQRILKFQDFPTHKAWLKPTSEMNQAFGHRHFVRLNEVLTSEDLCRNDRIFLKCTVHDKKSPVYRPGSVYDVINQL